MMRLATGEAAAVESTCTAYVLEARNSASRIRRLLAGRVPPAGDSWWRITITGQRGIQRGEHPELWIPEAKIAIVATTARTSAAAE